MQASDLTLHTQTKSWPRKNSTWPLLVPRLARLDALQTFKVFGGNSAGAQRDATTDQPLIELDVSAETRVALGLPVKGSSQVVPIRAADGLLVKAGSQDSLVKTGSPTAAPPTSAAFLIQQSISNEGCHFGPQTKNSLVDTSVAVENVMLVAEQRHQDVMYRMTSVAEERHRREVAQLAGDATRAMQVQANDYANAQHRLSQEAIRSV